MAKLSLTILSFALLSILVKDSYQQVEKSELRTNVTLPNADKFLHLYGLPVGQGDTYIVQCPNLIGGKLTVVDMGSSESKDESFWDEIEVGSMIPKVFNSHEKIKKIRNIYITCNETNLPSPIKSWLQKFTLDSKVRTFKNGSRCGPNGKACGFIDVCSNPARTTKNINARVLAANWGQQCGKNNVNSNNNNNNLVNKKKNSNNNDRAQLNKNTDVMVISLAFNKVKTLMIGDFEDFTPSENEEGPYFDLVNYYKTDLLTSVYQLAHHGAENLANKKIIRQATKPTALYVSSNPYYSYFHPRCNIIDAFLKEVKSVCKPQSKLGDKFYCGAHPLDKPENRDVRISRGFVGTDYKLQKNYVCGEQNGTLRNVTNNEYAIYSTVPDEMTLNIVEYITDGLDWGFVNNFVPRF
ncbi:hypothetical protein HELRODRAFT_184033 [Helobdella robusta]|uniref:Metallo-beta-lactamase domain-containing protein n=1 Tax=Helobdella robusta TaxID=6412 RepID=T1FKG7_HELRO|nr:hypothetical protein HELRODRAFT_184033 [Helobdella robusta]ESO08684.1 hypothetical protein HELRODRAFT_184033 [Helobdella robusta]